MGVVLKPEFLKVKRSSEREVLDRETLYEILDAGQVAHVGIADDRDFPIVIPLAYVRDGDRILLHGSTGSRIFRKLASGINACVTITLLDGIVAARSAFHSSMNYRSVMIFGTVTVLADDQKELALEIFTNNLIPGRWQEVRAMTAKENAATMVLAIELTNISGKTRTGGPDDEPAEDVVLPIWAGEIPINTSLGDPVPAADLPAGIRVSPAIKNLK